MQFDGVPWKFQAPPRCLALLAMLSVAHTRTSSRASLASALWPDELDATARANLRRHLHRIQQALPQIEGIDWIQVDARDVRFNGDAPLWVDVVAFESAGAGAETRAAAIELYRGDLLESYFDENLLADRERLRSLYLEACREEAMAARQALDFAQANRYVDRILALDEWREDALRLGMAIRYESGDRSSALAQFERFSTRLAAEMGIEPMPETLALRDAILMNAPIPGVRSAELEESSTSTQTRLPFVGRASEEATLDAAWRHAARGRGTTFFLGGAAGIGKSRLAAEFASSVGAQGGRVLFGETSNPQAYPYEPIVNALRHGLPLLVESPVEGPWLAALAEVVPELQAAFPDLAQATALAPEKARTRLFEAIARAIERLARVRPLLLVLEDAHWAQAATLDVIETLARRIGAVPALMLVTHRTGDVALGQSLSALRVRLQSERRATSLDLQPLQNSDVQTLVEKAVPSQRGVAGDLAETIAARSGGNPLFIGQLLSSYSETGELRTSGVTATILDRLAALDAPATNVAHMAAAIGRSFSIDLLSSALGWNEGETFDALGSLLDRGLVRASGSSAYSFAFSHALIESAVYDAIPEDERPLRHRRIAQVLSRNQGEEPQVRASVARHWKLGGDSERAGAAYAEAARSALAVYARAEAIELGRSAIDGGLAPEAEFATLLLVSQASRAFADTSTWKRDLDRLVELAAERGEEARFAVREELARYYSQIGDREQQRSVTEEMLAIATDIDRPDLRTNALQELALLDMQQGRLAAAMSRCEEALAIATAAKDEKTEGVVRNLMLRVSLRFNDYPAVDRHLAVLDELAAREPTHDNRIRLLEAKLYAAMETDDAARCKEVGQQLLELANAIGDSRLEVNARAALSLGALRLGSMREMREHLELAIAICERLVLADHALSFRLNQAVFELQVGNFQKTLGIIDQIKPALENMGAELHLCAVAFTRSEALLLAGDNAGALENAKIADELSNKTGALGFIAGTRLRLGTALCANGDIDRGLELLREAVEMRRERGPAVRLIDALAGYLQALLDARRANAVLEPVATELASLYERHAASAWRPCFALSLLARAARAAGDETAAKNYLKRGKAALQQEIERLDDAETAAAFRNLPHHKALRES